MPNADFDSGCTLLSMRSNKADISRKLNTILYVLMIISMAAMMISVASQSGRSLFLVLLSFILSYALVWAIRLCLSVRVGNVVFAVLLALYFLGLFFLARSYGNHWEACILSDYSHLYQGASELNNGLTLSDEAYFLTYSNNIKPMIILSLLMRFSELIGMNDPYGLLLFISCTFVVLSVISVCSIIKRNEYRLPVLILFCLCIPVWFYSNYFYTDTLSFCVGICSVALALTPDDNRFMYLKLILCGSLISLGIAIKITSIIPMIALVVCFVLNQSRTDKRYRKNMIRRSAVLLISFILFQILISLYMNSYDIVSKARECGNPVSSWIALGMKGDGTWSDNWDFVNELNSYETTREKKAFVGEYIADNLGETVRMEHIVLKFRRNYGSGTFDARNMLTNDPVDHFFYRMFSSGSGGMVYRITYGLCFLYIFTLYGIMIRSMIRGLISLLKKETIPDELRIGHISFWGMMIFLMLWEAHNRQLYNQIPVLVMTAVLGCDYLKSFGKSKKKVKNS